MSEPSSTVLTDAEILEHVRARLPHLSLPEPDSDFAVGEAWRLGAKELHAWAHDVLVAALGRINHISRDHPIWTGTNQRPTLMKLDSIMDWVLARDPADVAALRTSCALAVIYCPTEFAAWAWVELWRMGQLGASLALSAALWCELNSGSALRDALTTQPDFLEQNAQRIEALRTARCAEIRRFANDLLGTARPDR